MIVEVFAEEAAAEPMRSGIFQGLGPFQFSNLRYRKEGKVIVRGKLHIGAASRGNILEASAEVQVSGENDGTAAVTLNY